MNRTNWIIVSVALTAAVAVFSQRTAVGEERGTTIALQTPESAMSSDGPASARTADTSVGDRLISTILGRPAEAPAEASQSSYVTASDVSFVASTDTANQSSACDTCNGCKGRGCCNGCFGGFWVVEAEGVFLIPTQRQNFGSVEFIDANGSVIQSFCSRNGDDFVLTPRLTLGWQGECWGLQARYWRLETGELNPNYIVDHPFSGAVPGDGLEVNNHFLAETVDIEGTRLLCVGDHGAQVLLSFGFRYAQLDEAAGLSVTSTNDALGSYQGNVVATHKFSGAGITTGLRGLRPIGCSNFNLFFGARGSVLWDQNASNFVATSADFQATDGYAHTFNGGYAESPASLFIGEIQAGLQWNAPLKCIPANAFARVAVEYQYWCTTSCGGEAAFSAAGPLSGPFVLASGRSVGNSAFDLVGLSLGTGLTW